MAEKLKEGIQLYRSRKYTEALTFFLSLPSGSPEQGGELAYYIGLCYARLLRYDDALLYLEQVVTANSSIEKTWQCRMILSVIYALTDRVRLADFELHKLLDSGMKSPQIFSALGFVAWVQKRGDDAVKWYEKALALDADNLTAVNGLGYILAEMEKDLTRSLSLCRKAVDIEPDSAACLDSLGWAYFKLGLKKEAKTYITRARDKEPKSPEICEHLEAVKRQMSSDREYNGFSSGSGGVRGSGGGAR